jgi:two-component system NtrC family sensor kinase
MADGRDTLSGLDPAQLRQINRLATAARMVAGLAHELNNSLQVVSGLVELLGDRGDMPDDAVARIQKIGGQAEKATAAIRQVVTYTRELGQDIGAVNVSALADQALALRRYNLGRAGIVAASDLPPEPVTITADGRAVLQVLLNLVLNAEEALANQPERQLRIGVERGDNGAVRIAVSDTGHGIPDALRERIFEPFFTTRTGERAVGLGLPVARALASQSGGSLVLHDAGPGTTTFVVTWAV